MDGWIDQGDSTAQAHLHPNDAEAHRRLVRVLAALPRRLGRGGERPVGGAPHLDVEHRGPLLAPFIVVVVVVPFASRPAAAVSVPVGNVLQGQVLQERGVGLVQGVPDLFWRAGKKGRRQECVWSV